ncbi:MAG: hypothetical protein IJZ81_02800 [Clostridia bacterium]|nr:hypothetical protein [Clostridia bacterium]
MVNSERKILYMSAAVNFIVGTVIGMILFYGQMNSNPQIFSEGYIYDKGTGVIDFLRITWLNLMWIFSVFIARNILPLPIMHPVVAIRGCAGAFSAMYIFNCIGIKEAVASVLPQCFSVLPFIIIYSVETAINRKNLPFGETGSFTVKRSQAGAIFLFSFITAGLEVLFFRFFCVCLF